MPIVKNTRTSPAKKFPGLVEVYEAQIVLLDQEVQIGVDVFRIPLIVIDVPRVSESTFFRIVLARSGIVVERRTLGQRSVDIEDEVTTLASFSLNADQDLRETDVEVNHVLLERNVHVLTNLVAWQTSHAEAEARAELKRETDEAITAVTAKPPAQWTPDETKRALAALLRDKGIPVPQDTPDRKERGERP
jgi:hypothetical protein